MRSCAARYLLHLNNTNMLKKMDKEDSKLLQTVLDTANLDISSLKEVSVSSLSQPLLTVAELVKGCEVKMKVDLKGAEIWQEITGLMQNDDTRAALAYLIKVKGIFAAVLHQIMNNKVMLDADFSGSISLSMKGTQSETTTKDSRAFVFTFSTNNKPRKIEDVAKLVLLNMISSLQLEPRRFGVCKCKGCENYFYKPKSTKKGFCSTACSNKSR